jgi:hypothetical protein
VGVLQRAVDDGGVGEDDEAEAAGAAGKLVAHDGGLSDLAVGGEMLAQLVLRRLPRDAANEELALVRVHLAAASAASRSPAAGGDGGRAELGISGGFGFGAVRVGDILGGEERACVRVVGGGRGGSRVFVGLLV